MRHLPFIGNINVLRSLVPRAAALGIVGTFVSPVRRKRCS